jgi:hypothetical protein
MTEGNGKGDEHEQRESTCAGREPKNSLGRGAVLHPEIRINKKIEKSLIVKASQGEVRKETSEDLRIESVNRSSSL